MNWGGFAGGFASGFSGGVAMGKTFKDAMKEKKIEDVRAQGMAEAQAAREAAVNDSIKEGPAATGVTGKPAEQVTAPAATPTDSIIQNPEKATGAVVTPVATGQTTPSNPAGLPAPGDGARAIAQEPAKPITPQAAEMPAAQGLPFTVGGKGYATREEARKAAEKNAPGVMEFMSKTLVPRMQQAYIEQGNVEMADAWGKWAEEKDNKAAMKEWAGAYRAATTGNFEKAADHVFNLYKRYDDGITPMSKEVVKDKDGNITGFNVRLKNDASGEERTQFIDKKALTEMGLSALAPPQMFEAQFRRQQEADKAAAANAAELAKEDRAFKRENYKDDKNHGQAKELKTIDQANALEKLSIEKQLEAANASTKVKREVGAKVEALRSAGYSQEFINGVLPGIIGVGEFKKATAPEEARRLAHSDRMKADPMYSRKSEAEQQAILDRDMKLIYGGVKPSSTPATAAPTTPAAGGLPQQATPQKKGTPFYDTATGTIVYR